MDNKTTHYLRCPYCGKDGEHSKKVSKSVGLYRVKELYDNVLLFECRKCGRVFRVQKIGSILQWSDMSPEERKLFQKKSWVSYNNLNGGKNDTDK